MSDIEELRAKAKAKAAKAKAGMATRKALKENPPPQYVEPVEYIGDGEADDAADLSALEEGFRKRAKDEGRRFALATDTEYWTCLCFQTREQKEAFLAALKLLPLGDKYINGEDAAHLLGIELPPADVPYNTSARIDKAWLEFTD
ncbi:hypothetical protein [Kerstersia gyiorum]|uniref:hypothetical protein n=1 Tax=Kerstersia gyiorum TaxID=206506 RepID=UPI0030CBAF05